MGKKQKRRQLKESRQEGRARSSAGRRGFRGSLAEATFLGQGQFRLEQWLGRRRRWIWAGLLAVAAALYLAVPSNELGGNFGGDDVQYLLLSKALATGLGYADPYLPGHPPHTKYPPLFPLLLAPFNLLGRHQLLGVHLLICALALGVPLALAGWMRRQGYSQTATLGVFLLSATLPRYYQFLVHVLSEVPSMFFCYFALYGMARAGSRPKARDLLLITLASLATLFTRTAGMALVAAIGIELLRRAEFRRLRVAGIPSPIFFGLVVGLVFLAWSLRNFWVGGPSLGYFQEMILKDVYQPQAGNLNVSEFASRVYERTYLYLTVLGLMTAGGIILIVKSQVHYYHVFFLLPLLLGFISRLRQAERSAEWFFLFSVLIVISWWSYEDRFLIPLLPFASFYFMLGVRKMAGAARSWMRLASAPVWARSLTGVVGLVILLNQAWIVAGVVQREHTDLWEPGEPVAITNYGVWQKPVINWSKYEWGLLDPGQIQLFTRMVILSRIAAERVPAGQVMVCRKPTLAAFFFGWPSVCFLFTNDVKAQWEFLRRNQVTYALLLFFNQPIKDWFDSCPSCFQLEFGVEGGLPLLYKIVAYPRESGGSK